MSDYPFGLRENPFIAGDVRRFVHPSPEREAIRARLLRGLRDGEPFVLLTGESGTGKTSIVRETFGNRKDQGSVAIVTNPALTRTELLEEICIRFDIVLPETPSKPQLIALLEQHLTKVRGQSHGLAAVLVIDEAHLLDVDLLEELRLLANMQAKGRKLLQVVLVGLPVLEETLAQRRLEPLRQRITVHGQLHALNAEQTRDYLHHRLLTADAPIELLPDPACDEIHLLSHGIVREINTLASEALVWAHSEGAEVVTADHVRAVAAARPGPSTRSAPAEAEPAPEPTVARAPGRKRRAEAAEPALETLAEAPEREPAPAAAPSSERAASAPTPVAPASSPEPATLPPMPAAPASSPESTNSSPAIQPTPRRRKGEAEVHDWVSRFKGDGPIMIGSRAALQALSMEESLGLDTAGGDDLGATMPRPETEGPRRRPPGRRRVGRSRRGSRWWNRVSGLSLAAVAVLVATVVSILIARGRDTSRARAKASPVATAGPLSRSTRSPERKPERATHGEREAAVGTPAPPPAASAAATDPAAAPTTRYALVVATYLDEDRAREEVDRLAALTALPARSRVTSDATGTTYRILVGRFDTRAAAEQAAEELLGRGIVGEARVTRLGPRRAHR